MIRACCKRRLINSQSEIKVYVVDESKIPARSVLETNGDILRLHAEQVPDFRFSALRLRGTQLCLTGTEEARFIGEPNSMSAETTDS
jgi:hypothetical protein